VRRPPWGLIPLVALGAGLVAGRFSPNPEALEILDVGQGDCAVLRHAGVTILIDDGPVQRFGTARQAAVTAALRRRGIDDVDFILLSHPDADHVGGTESLVRQFPNAKIGISAEFLTQPKLDQEIGQWRAGPGSIFWLPESSDIRLPGCTLRIYCPVVGPRDDDNRGSMFIRIDDGGATADFSGDAPSEVEDQAAASGVWTADVLHVGHHGSRTATGVRWIEAVRPSFAVISCGRDNPYGHPHRATLERLAAARIPVDRTDLEGDVIFVPMDGHFRRGR
jgi:competence protein ComEC